MSEQDHTSFDLIGALQGISYPEETFSIFFDGASAKELYDLNRQMDAADPTSEGFKKLEEKFLSLIKQFRDTEYKITIRGISQAHYADALETVIEEAEAFGKKGKSQIELSQFLETRQEQLLWAQFIVKIEDPQGRVRAPLTNEEATELYNRLPEPSRREVERRIAQMNDSTSRGYEIGVSDFDFLSEPSQEG